MSEERVEVVRRILRAFGDRDTDSASEYLEPDVEWEPATPAALEGAVHRGREKVLEAAASLWELWEVFRFEEAEVRDHGDSILWLGYVLIKGSGSKVELRQEFAVHFEMEGKRIRRARARLSWDEGFEAAGLES
jgi:ketosteroid isomerase-like protein